MSYNLYIRSNKSTYDLILKNQIVIDANKLLKCNVKKFYTLNSMYNVSETIGNNTFELQLFNNNVIPNTTTLQLYTIPDGNYSVLTLRDTLNVLLNGLMTVSYNYSNNTYTFTKTTLTYFTITFKNVKCSQLIGLKNDTVITTSGIKGTYINMVDYSQLIIMSDLNYMDMNQDNILYDENMRISQILLQVVRQDVEPFRAITYDNDDVSYNLLNNNINRIRFKIMNEKGKEVIDIGDWYLHLNFEIIEKEDLSPTGRVRLALKEHEDLKSMFSKVMKTLLDIKHILMTLLFK